MQLQSPDTLDTVVYQRLKEMIISKQLKPGELLVQNQISQMLGVSRTPLRKALGELEMEGLLYSSPKGWYVKEFTIQDMISVFQIRSLLEGLACRLAAARISSAEIAYMRTLFQEAYDGYKGGSVQAYYAADVEFHAMIVAKAGDAVLERTIKSNQIVTTSQLQGLYRDPHETMPEHLGILDALAAKDGEAAELLMREHIGRAVPLLQSGSYELYK
jgi:DNA-binding GntR family transcriptional regulator